MRLKWKMIEEESELPPSGGKLQAHLYTNLLVLGRTLRLA